MLLTTKTRHHDLFYMMVSRYFDLELIYESSEFIINKQYEELKAKNADVYIVFGLDKLKGGILDLPLINIHRGDSEQYRGLDSLWWALKERNLAGMKVTVHFIDNELDTGDIIIQKNIWWWSLDNLLIDSTKVAARAVIKALKYYQKHGKFKRKKAKRGRYFSQMPERVKDELRQRKGYSIPFSRCR